MPKNDQIWPKIGIFGQFGPGHAGFFGALLVGRLVVVARGLYLARHLFTLLIFIVGDETEIRVPENQIGFEEKSKVFGKHNNSLANFWIFTDGVKKFPRWQIFF